MCFVVTGIGTLIHVYSYGYMDDEPAAWRFFALLNLFMFAMLCLVMGDNLLMMFLGWEGVGLCSWGLIGFWFSEMANARAGNKAFIVNRVGDFGFTLGVFLLFWTLDSHGAGTIVFRELARFGSPDRRRHLVGHVGGNGGHTVLVLWAQPANRRRSPCTSGYRTRWPVRLPFPH